MGRHAALRGAAGGVGARDGGSGGARVGRPGVGDVPRGTGAGASAAGAAVRCSGGGLQCLPQSNRGESRGEDQRRPGGGRVAAGRRPALARRAAPRRGARLAAVEAAEPLARGGAHQPGEMLCRSWVRPSARRWSDVPSARWGRASRKAPASGCGRCRAPCSSARGGGAGGVPGGTGQRQERGERIAGQVLGNWEILRQLPEQPVQSDPATARPSCRRWTSCCRSSGYRSATGWRRRPRRASSV